MASRVAFSDQNVDITAHALHHNDVEKALNLYFSPASPHYMQRFIGDSPSDVANELSRRLDELDLSSTFTVLGAVEASFRVDYLQRCYAKRKDPISRQFRQIYKKYGNKAYLDQHIFATWQELVPQSKDVIFTLRGAFRFRDWLAHGRYWRPKLGRRYDYLTVYTLAEAALTLVSDVS